MARYIDAEEFLDLFYVAAFKQDKLFVKTVEMVVDDTPTADVVEVKHGKWERVIRNGKPRGIKCSLCGKHIHFHENYCPRCGAKMDGGNAE